MEAQVLPPLVEEVAVEEQVSAEVVVLEHVVCPAVQLLLGQQHLPVLSSE